MQKTKKKILKMLKMKNQKEKSFTLLELLVVIAVIAILAATVMVSLNSTRQIAQEARGLKFSQNIKSTLATDLVGEWTFDSVDIQGNIAKDTSGNGNNGTIYGATPVQGKVREALSFDGNDYVQIKNSPSLNLPGDNESVFLWVKHNNSDYIFFQNNGWSRRLYKNYWAFYSPLKYLQLPGLNDNNWHFVGYTIMGTKVDAYLDGKLVDTATITVPPANSYWWIGRVCGGATCESYYTGLVDEVQIYNRALTAYEIKALYAEGKMRHLAER
jgi:prepilin-type N-terminal cleavage/methylation domain-containing protein